MTLPLMEAPTPALENQGQSVAHKVQFSECALLPTRRKTELMILSINLTEPTVALLRAEATRMGRTVEAVAAERLAETVAADMDLDAVAGVLEGLTEADAGHSRPLAEFQAERDAFWQAQQ